MVLRYLAALGSTALIAAIGFKGWLPLFIAGWWACAAWLLITKQWRPFA